MKLLKWRPWSSSWESADISPLNWRSEMTQRALTELRQYLANGTQALLEGLRHAGESDRAFRQSQVDAAMRFCSKVSGREYVALLGKAAEVAAATEPKAVRA